MAYGVDLEMLPSKAAIAMRKQGCLITSFILFLAVVLVGGGVVWHITTRRIEQERQAFIDKYQRWLTREIRQHFFVFEELPGCSLDLIYENSQLRRPWVYDSLIEFGYDRPSIDAGWEQFEVEMFERTIRLCRAKAPQWQDELTEARKPLVDLEGNLSAQLDLFVDPKFDCCAGHYLLKHLQANRGVEEETLMAFLDAYMDVREAKMILGHHEAVPAARTEKFKMAKTAVLEQAK